MAAAEEFADIEMFPLVKMPVNPKGLEPISWFCAGKILNIISNYMDIVQEHKLCEII